MEELTVGQDIAGLTPEEISEGDTPDELTDEPLEEETPARPPEEDGEADQDLEAEAAGEKDAAGEKETEEGDEETDREGELPAAEDKPAAAEPTMVPLSALQEERRKRQDIAERLRKYEEPPATTSSAEPAESPEDTKPRGPVDPLADMDEGDLMTVADFKRVEAVRAETARKAEIASRTYAGKREAERTLTAEAVGEGLDFATVMEHPAARALVAEYSPTLAGKANPAHAAYLYIRDNVPELRQRHEDRLLARKMAEGKKDKQKAPPPRRAPTRRAIDQTPDDEADEELPDTPGARLAREILEG